MGGSAGWGSRDSRADTRRGGWNRPPQDGDFPGCVGKAGAALGAPGRFRGRRGKTTGGHLTEESPAERVGLEEGPRGGLGAPARPGRELRVPHSPGASHVVSDAGADTLPPGGAGRWPRIRAPGEPPGGLPGHLLPG